MKTFLLLTLISFNAFAVTYRGTLYVENNEWKIESKSMTLEVTDSDLVVTYPELEDFVCLQSSNEIETKVSISCLGDTAWISFKDKRPTEFESGAVYILVDGE